MKFPNPHEHADRIGMALDLAVAAKILDDPSLVDVARRNLARWRKQNGGTSAPAHQEWERVLRFLSAEKIAGFIVSRAPMAMRLSQSSPFAGVLTQEERRRILNQHEPATA